MYSATPRPSSIRTSSPRLRSEPSIVSTTLIARHDYYFLNGLQYVDIGIAEAKRLIQAGVGEIDEDLFPDAARKWREDTEGMDPEIVFASMAADLA